MYLELNSSKYNFDCIRAIPELIMGSGGTLKNTTHPKLTLNRTTHQFKIDLEPNIPKIPVIGALHPLSWNSGTPLPINNEIQ